MPKDNSSVLDDEDEMDFIPSEVLNDDDADDDSQWPPLRFLDDNPKAGKDEAVEEDTEDDGDLEDDDEDDEENPHAIAMANDRAEITRLREELEQAKKGLSEKSTEADQSLELSIHGVEANAQALNYAKEVKQGQVAFLTKSLRRHKEDGDVDLELEVADQLAKLKDELGAIDRNLGEIPRIKKTFEDRLAVLRADREKAAKEVEAKPEATRRSSALESSRPQTDLAKTWASANPWMTDPKNRVKTAALMSIDSSLAEEGYDPTTPLYFRELTRRMHREFPSLGVKHSDGKAPASGKRVRGGNKKGGAPLAAPGITTSATQRSKRNSKPDVEITNSDRSMLRKLRLNPSDPNVLKMFAKNKNSNSKYMA